MRNRLMTLTAALVLASASIALAQQTPAAPAASAGVTPTSGWIDVGFRGTSSSGDEARYERYRDLRTGAATNIFLSRDTSTYTLGLTARNIGYRDQKYGFSFQNSKFKFSGLWDSIPLNYCYNCLTPWVGGENGVFSLDTAARTSVQNRVPGVVGIPTTPAQLATPSIYRGLAKTIPDFRQGRDTLGFNLTYEATQEVGVNVGFTSTHKGGLQPFGMAFAFNNGNELPMPLDNRTNDLTVALEWARPQGMFRAAVDHSMFSNQYNQFEWDNPLRVTDYDCRITNLAPATCSPAGYDTNGYSNGNGPAKGRISSFPDNSMTVVSFMGLYKMPRRTTINGTVQIINQTQDDELIPWTTNSVINQPIVWASFPDLAELERATAEAKVRAVNALMNFTSRPVRKVGINVKYRHNTHANLTRPYNGTEYVRFDAVPEETGSESFGHDVVRDTVDATVSFDVLRQGTLRVGYGYDNFNRTGRAHNDMRDNAFRVTYDTVGNQYVTLRFGYEFVNRTGYGFSEMAIEEGGAQPGLRFYDEADRDRNRASLLVTLMPTDKVDLTASVAYGKDAYGGPGLEFGLLDNKNTAFNIGASFTPIETVVLGMNYGRENYNTFQKSRNANPPPDPSWTDPNRDWTLDNDEKVNSVDIYVDVLKAIKKTDIRVAYSYSDSDNGFLLGGPRVEAYRNNLDPTTGRTVCAAGVTTCFEALPNVTNTWHNATVDVRYSINEKVGIGAGYWYEKLDVTDFATINLADGTPRIDYLGGLTTGYGNRPYNGSTFFLRLFYLF